MDHEEGNREADGGLCDVVLKEDLKEKLNIG